MSEAATLEDQHATLGHNSGDEFRWRFIELEERKAKLIEVGDKWITAEDRKEITDDETATKLDTFIKQCKALEKAAEQTRKDEKEPHLAACRTVDAKYKGLQDPVAKIIKALSPRLTAYLTRKEKERQEAERKAREEAARKAREIEEARLKAMQSETPTASESAISKMEEEAASAAQEAEAIAAQKTQLHGDFGSAKGLRSTWSAEITDYDAALAHFKHHEKVKEAVLSIANGLARSPASRGIPVPGVKFNETKSY